MKECSPGKKPEIGSWPLHGESDGGGRRGGRSSSSPRKRDDPLKTFQLLFRPCCLLRGFLSCFSRSAWLASLPSLYLFLFRCSPGLQIGFCMATFGAVWRFFFDFWCVEGRNGGR